MNGLTMILTYVKAITVEFTYRSAPKEVAISTAVSTDLIKTGVFLEFFQPREEKKKRFTLGKRTCIQGFSKF